MRVNFLLIDRESVVIGTHSRDVRSARELAVWMLHFAGRDASCREVAALAGDREVSWLAGTHLDERGLFERLCPAEVTEADVEETMRWLQSRRR